MEGTENSEIRNIRAGDWYWINKAVLYLYGHPLKVSGIAVYNALASFANSKTQRCYPSQDTIARLIGLSKRTVMRKLKLLESLGLIKIERKGINCGYYLLKVRPEVTKETKLSDKGIPLM